MSLATEKTNTQWYSNNGVACDSKEDAEYASMQSILGEAALNRFELSPFCLLDQLKHYPDAWAWLQQQMSSTVAGLPKEAPPVDFRHAIDVAKSKIMNNGEPNAEYPTITSRMLGNELRKHYILVKKT